MIIERVILKTPSDIDVPTKASHIEFISIYAQFLEFLQFWRSPNIGLQTCSPILLRIGLETRSVRPITIHLQLVRLKLLHHLRTLRSQHLSFQVLLSYLTYSAVLGSLSSVDEMHFHSFLFDLGGFSEGVN